jgi:hypothetical protein
MSKEGSNTRFPTMAEFIPISIDGNPHVYIQSSQIVSLTAGYSPTPSEDGSEEIEFNNPPSEDDIFTLSIAMADGQTFDLRGSVAEVTYDLLTGHPRPTRGEI